jgi:hypothetical protein
LIGPSLITNKKLWRLPKIEGLVLKYQDPSLSFIYIGESMTTFAKAYGIKVKCYGKHVGEHIGNTLDRLMWSCCWLKCEQDLKIKFNYENII